MSENLSEKRIEEFLQEAPEASREEIAAFRKLVEDYFLGKIASDEFKTKRLHMGTYGIRNTKDVHMMRIKIPLGKLNSEQIDCLADLAEAYSKGVGHITTRQDMQLYWIPTREAPLAMARAASVGLTTREACGNSVRNVTACPFAGVSVSEVFDVTKHAEAVASHFLRNPASQKLPRKFKIAFEGCPEDHIKTAIHDIGAVAAIQNQDGKRQLGFRLYVGGGLGAAPMSAILLESFTPTTELLRTCEALVRVHDRLGDRKNKASARMKFVVKRLGPEAFRKEVFAERDKLPLQSYEGMYSTGADEQPSIEAPSKKSGKVLSAGEAFGRWTQTNVAPQKQTGYSTVIIRLRLGDISSHQMRALAKIARSYSGGKACATITQNLMLRWIRYEDLPAVFGELEPVGLAQAESEKLYDVTSCPGAETCQLGIAASRGLSRALESRLREAGVSGKDIEDIRIKVSGCPNSCGQHHIANIGFFGGARKINGYLVPHFQLLLGGFTEEAKAVFGKPVIKLPARRVPEALLRILDCYRTDRSSPKETFAEFVMRVGIDYWKKVLEGFTTLPAHEESPEAYRDWGAETDFSLAGMGPGECAS